MVGCPPAQSFVMYPCMLRNLSEECSSVSKGSRILCVQVRRRPIRDGLGAVLGGALTCYFWCLKCGSDLTVLTGNFQNDSMICL